MMLNELNELAGKKMYNNSLKKLLTSIANQRGKEFQTYEVSFISIFISFMQWKDLHNGKSFHKLLLNTVLVIYCCM